MKEAHLWVGDTPTPNPGDRAVCGYVFGVFRPAPEGTPHCPACELYADRHHIVATGR